MSTQYYLGQLVGGRYADKQHFSGQFTVATAGTAVQGPAVVSETGFWLKAHPDNTDVVWVGNDNNNDVSSSNGFPLDPGETIYANVIKLTLLWFDSDVNGGKICWLRA